MHPQWKSIAPIAALTATIALGACQKRTAEEPDAEPVMADATPPPSTPRATPAAANAEEPNYFAPPGVYFLLAGTSVETPDGIVGLRAGTRLQKTDPGKYTGGGFPLELRDEQVTNDLRVAQRIIGADQAAQAAWRQSIRAAEAAASARAQAAVPKSTPSNIVASGKPVPTPMRSSTALGSSGGFSQTKSQDGWIWELDANGNWQPIRPNR